MGIYFWMDRIVGIVFFYALLGYIDIFYFKNIKHKTYSAIANNFYHLSDKTFVCLFTNNTHFICFIIFFKKNYFFFIRIILVSFLPLIFFLISKFFITKDLGLTPFTGVQLSGHAVFYLDKDTIKKMSNNENIMFANKMIDKKKKLSYLCNENSPKNLTKEYVHWQCWNVYLIEAWMEMVRQETSLTPFLDENKNVEPWRYINMDSFFGKIKNNTFIDSKLRSFSIEILSLNKKNHTIWMYESSYLISKLLIGHPATKIIFIISFLSAIFFVFFSKKNYLTKMKFFSENYEECLLFSIILYSFISLIFFSALHIPDMRTAGVQFIFLIPVCVSYILYRIVKKKIN